MRLEMPTPIETQRPTQRKYRPGDGQWHDAMSRRNRCHLAPYEAGNVVMTIACQQDAKAVMRDRATEWEARNCSFMGAFLRETVEFVA